MDYRVTLVTCSDDNEYYPHPHSLFVKEKLYQKKIYENWDSKNLTKTGHYSGPHYIRIGTNRQDFTARYNLQLLLLMIFFRFAVGAQMYYSPLKFFRFEGMCIINSKKENFYSSVREKLQKKLREQKYGYYKFHHSTNMVSEFLKRTNSSSLFIILRP